MLAVSKGIRLLRYSSNLWLSLKLADPANTLQSMLPLLTQSLARSQWLHTELAGLMLLRQLALALGMRLAQITRKPLAAQITLAR
jgi:hypothetical protein